MPSFAGCFKGRGLTPKSLDRFWKKLVWLARLWTRLLWDCYWQPTSRVWPNNFSSNLTTFPALERLNKAAQLVRTLPFEVNLWKTQNICYKILHTHCPNSKEKAGPGDQNAKEWLRHYTVLAENFLLRVPVCTVNSKPTNG